MIRPAELKDRIAMVRMARAFAEAAGLALPFDAVWAETSAKAWIADADKLALVLDLEGVRGMLCAAWAQSPLAPVRIASEQVFWIEPAARGSDGARWARDMMAEYEAWARVQGCGLIGMAALAGQRTGVLYERRGFTAVETHYMKGL